MVQARPGRRVRGGSGPSRAVRQRVYSQNFLIDRRAIGALVAGSGVQPGDLVVDIGAGNGLITQALARRGARVLAIERDPGLAGRLRDRFGPGSGVTVVAGDVLTAQLPREPFAVVANIPFSITTKILRRLLGDTGGRLRRADVIVQAEVARKRGTGGRGTLLNATWEPWYEFGAGARVPRVAFRPQPRVDGAVLIAVRREPPLLQPSLRRAYEGFVTGVFGGARPTVSSALTRSAGGARAMSRQRFGALASELGFPADALPSQLTVEHWVGLFLASRGAAGRGAASGGAASSGPTARGPAPRRGAPGQDGRPVRGRP
jgi:23S rRNA (adenine-N6)-dimethyltransferase